MTGKRLGEGQAIANPRGNLKRGNALRASACSAKRAVKSAFIVLFILFYAVTSLRSANAQTSRFIRQLAEDQAAKILSTIRKELTLGKDIHYHVFGKQNGTYLFDEQRNALFELKSGTVNDAIEECKARHGAYAEDLLTNPTINTAIYPSAAETRFVTTMHLDGSPLFNFFTVRGSRQSKLFEITSSSGQRVQVTAVSGHTNILQRATSRIAEDELLRALSEISVSPGNLHVVAYYRDTTIEQQLGTIPGIKVTVVPPENPQLILEIFRRSQPDELIVLLGHNENGVFRVPGAKAEGISGDDVAKFIEQHHPRTLLWGCESGIDFKASGPQHVVYIDEAVARLKTGIKKGNLLGFLGALEDTIVIDETIARDTPSIRAKSKSYAEAKKEFLEGVKTNPILVLPPVKTRYPGPNGGAMSPDAGVDFSNTSPSGMVSSGAVSADPPPTIDAGAIAEASHEGTKSSGDGSNRSWTIVIIMTGLLGGVGLFLFTRRR